MQFGYSAPVYWNFGAGGVINVLSGTLNADTNGTAVWSNNLGSVNVASGATFLGGEGNVRIDALTGSGNFEGAWAARGYINTTIGVNNDSSQPSNTATFLGVVENYQSPLNLVKVGTGTQILAGANTYTGTTTVSGGDLVIGGLNGGSLKGTISSSSAITVNAGALLSLVNTSATGSSGTAGSYTINGGTVSDDSGGAEHINGNLTMNGGTLTSTNTNSLNTGHTFGTFSFSSNSDQVFVGGTAASAISAGVVLNGNQTFNISSTGAAGGIDLLVSGQLTGGGITKTGAGTLSLANSSNALSGLSMSAGQVVFASGGLGTGPVNMTGSSTLTWASGNTTDVTTNNGVTIADGVDATLNTDGNNVTLAMPFTLGPNKTATLTLDDTAATPGALLVDAVNSYSGGTTITAGTLRIGVAGAIGSAATAGPLSVSGALDLNGNSQSATAFSGSGSIYNNGSGLATLTVGNSGGGGTFSGVIADNTNSGSGTVGLAKIGSGTITLGGLNTYSGPTAINGGNLVLTLDGRFGKHGDYRRRRRVSRVSTGQRHNANRQYIDCISRASLTLVAGASFSMVDGAVGTLMVQQGSSFAGPALTLNGTSGSPNSMSFELGERQCRRIGGQRQRIGRSQRRRTLVLSSSVRHVAGARRLHVHFRCRRRPRLRVFPKHQNC